MLQIDVSQTGKGYVSIAFPLNHEAALAVHAAVVIVEHSDTFLSPLDDKILVNHSLNDFFGADEFRGD
jgi:hypothetical protein